MKLPTDAAILAFHKTYAPSPRAFEVVYTHSRIIADIAAELIASKAVDMDKEFIHAAALLHDVGYYPLFDTAGFVPHDTLITHGVVGARLLRESNLPEALARIAERHTGVGLTKVHILAARLPLPAKDFVAETPEERLVMYADKFHSKYLTKNDPTDSLGKFNSTEHYLAHARRFGEDNAARFTALVERYGVPDIDRLAQRYGQAVD
jgi:uncharacterized protein